MSLFHSFVYSGLPLKYDLTANSLDDCPAENDVALPVGTALSTEAETSAKPALDAAGKMELRRYAEGVLASTRLRRIQLSVSPRCNLSCSYCYSHCESHSQQEDMNQAVARSAVDFMLRSGLRRGLYTVCFVGGGEPLLNIPVIRAAVNYCRSLQIRRKGKIGFQVITNGTILSDELIDFLVENHFLVIVSIDGYKEMHNANRKFPDGTGSYEIVLENFRKIRERFEKVDTLGRSYGVRATMTLEHHNVARIYDELSNLDLSQVVLSVAQGDKDHVGLASDASSVMSDISIRTKSLMESILSKRKSGDALNADEARCLELVGKLPAIQDHSMLGASCGVGRNALAVDSLGRLYPCHRFLGAKSFEIGDIWQGLDTERAIRFFEKLRLAYLVRCAFCWVRRFCQGPCVWTLSAMDGSIASPDNAYCEQVRNEAERNLWFLRQLSGTTKT